MLCVKCANIHFRTLQKCQLPEDLLPLRLRGVSHDKGDSVYYFHHENIAALELSADGGCDFCVMLWTRLSKSDACYSAKPAIFSGQQVYFCRPWSDRLMRQNTAGLEDGGGLFMAHCEGHYITGAFTSTFAEPVEDNSEGLTLPNDPKFPAVEIDTCTTSAPNLRLATSWLQNCMKTHTPCSASAQSSALPRHVVDIKDPKAPYLRLGDDQPGQYVTLSYKWGESKKFCTTTSNYQELLRNIPLQNLPRTFLEAIQVAHSLGYQYLWIDALCIIQNSENDLQHEIGTMDTIYRNSALTLFAASGDNTDAGLSVLRDSRSNRPCKLDMKTTVGNWSSHISGDVRLYRRGVEDCPLYQRGWVLQEEILSPRALVFGSWQISWWCLCASFLEEQPKASWAANNSRNTMSNGLTCHLRSWLHEQNTLIRTSWQRDSPFDAWYEMITAYTLRSLTFRSDILPAVSGLASAIAHKYSCTYTAGLWEEDMQGGLAWFVARDTGEIRKDDVPGFSYFPTWSWASQWGNPIRFRGWEDAAAQVVHEGVELVSQDDKPAAEALNPFGVVRSSHITVSGRIREAVVGVQEDFRDFGSLAPFLGEDAWKETLDPHDWHPFDFEHNHLKLSRWTASVKDPETGRRIGQIALDSDSKTTPIDRIYCLLCNVTQTWDKIRLTCIALVPTDTTRREYRRVGLIFLREDQENWFGELNVSKVFSPANKGDPPTARRRLTGSKFLASVTII